jgi:hypothetical protein
LRVRVMHIPSVCNECRKHNRERKDSSVKRGRLPVRFLAHPGPPAFKPAKNIQSAVLCKALRFCVSVWKAGLRRTAADAERGLHVRAHCDRWCGGCHDWCGGGGRNWRCRSCRRGRRAGHLLETAAHAVAADLCVVKVVWTDVNLALSVVLLVLEPRAAGLSCARGVTLSHGRRIVR